MNRLQRLLFIPLLAVVLVALFGACSSSGDGEATEPAQNTEDATDSAQDDGESLSITAHDIKFSATELSTSAGAVEIELVNQGQALHTFVLDGQDLKVEAGPGQTVSGTAELSAGTYTYFCDVPGHRDAGMEGTLTVA